MGMYDDVLLKDVECTKCHEIIPEFHCQTKDFGCTLDQFIQGDDTRELVQRWFLIDSSMSRWDGSWEQIQNRLKDPDFSWKESLSNIKEEDVAPLTKEEIQEKYGDRSLYKIEFRDGDSWSVYQYHGVGEKNWSNIEGAIFNCYGECPMCGEFCDFTATIRNHLFIGVEK